MLEKLRETRLEKGVSQTFIAKKLGYKNASGYANIEMGRTKPSLENARIIADILEEDLNVLFFTAKLHEKSKKTTNRLRRS